MIDNQERTSQEVKDFRARVRQTILEALEPHRRWLTDDEILEIVTDHNRVYGDFTRATNSIWTHRDKHEFWNRLSLSIVEENCLSTYFADLEKGTTLGRQFF